MGGMIIAVTGAIITLPDANFNTGLSVEIVNGDGSAITVATVNGQAIGEVTTPYALPEADQFLVVRSDGGNWRIIGAG